ncbi:PREDICTED: protein ACCELERATED CELL DEATH 6-like [Nicotiana attenuata]|uniref:Protein accelerated cell death 6 n=1 Tax=Nicotiana attenuata TaxID=49451 RepID=A0A314KX20_NICAT|nr:PREDICTED: protein ACCELERATED CELL DEATH 6-like [Nicotiana attenuata]OIT33803.1 protein accelerated cell death 6 [Nicotiana attenuata]
MPMDWRLYEAAKEGDMKVLEEYKSRFATQLTPYNNTVLHIAAQYNGFYGNNYSDFLAIAGPELFSILNSNGDTFIHMAARKSNRGLIKAFINYMKNYGGLIDIEAGIPETREFLRITNNYGNTALHEAVMQRRGCSVVELLVKEDPDYSYPPNNAQKTPLYLAVEKANRNAVEHILNNSTSLSYGGPYGTTVLHAAAMNNTALCMEMILRKEPSLTKQADDFGWNPLHFAAYVGFKLPVITLLMEDKHMAYGSIKEENITPLHLAVINNKIQAVEEFIEQCPDSLDAVTSQGQNVLHIAYAKEHWKMITLFQQQHWDNNIFVQRDADGNMPHEVTGNVSFQSDHPCWEELDRNNIRWKELHKKWFKGRMEVWKERANTHLIVVTLILTVSFAAGFTIPGGYDDDGPNKGMAILSKKTAFKAFAVTDTIAVISSTAAVFLHYLATYEEENKRLSRYVAAGVLALVAMLAMMIAFMTGLYVVLSSTSLAIFICVICSVSIALFIFVLGKSFYNSFQKKRKKY